MRDFWNLEYDERDILQYRRLGPVWRMRESGASFKAIANQLGEDTGKACALVSGKNCRPYLAQMYQFPPVPKEHPTLDPAREQGKDFSITRSGFLQSRMFQIAIFRLPSSMILPLIISLPRAPRSEFSLSRVHSTACLPSPSMSKACKRLLPWSS